MIISSLHSLSYRSLSFIGFILCMSLMSAALYFQYFLDLEPCPLCILQRIALLSLAIILLMAALHNPSHKVVQVVYAGLACVASLFGMLIAGRHVWLQNLPADRIPDCGPGYDYIMNVFSVFEGLKIILEGSGECAEVDWYFMGLTMPAWTLIVFTIAIVLCLYVAIRQFYKVS